MQWKLAHLPLFKKNRKKYKIYKEKKFPVSLRSSLRVSYRHIFFFKSAFIYKVR